MDIPAVGALAAPQAVGSQVAVPKRVHVVANGASVHLPDGTLLMPGTRLIKETHGVTERWLADAVKSGHVEIAYATDTAPGQGLKPLGSVQGSPETAAKAGVGAEVAGVSTGRVKQASRWTLDPKALAGKSLEELNLLVREREPQIPAFKTQAEAIGQLSLDFGK